MTFTPDSLFVKAMDAFPPDTTVALHGGPLLTTGETMTLLGIVLLAVAILGFAVYGIYKLAS